MDVALIEQRALQDENALQGLYCSKPLAREQSEKKRTVHWTVDIYSF